MAAAAEPDGRRARGDRTRHKAARYAADLATVYGLDSISVGQVATGTGLSKSGILTVFDNREAIQLAAIAEARAIYIAEVIAPAWHLDPGVARLRGLVANWLTYVRGRVFPGGCFLAATSAEYAGREGDVAAAVRALKQDWLRLLEREFLVAGPAHESDPNSAHRFTFQLDAYLIAGVVRAQLLGDDGELDLAHDLAMELVERAAR